MSAANPLNPHTVKGGRCSRTGAWCWATALWFSFACYCVFTLIQTVQKTQTPQQTISYTVESGFTMPSVLVCSFGQYNLDSFAAEYPTLFAGDFWIQHSYEDLLTSGLANHTDPSEPWDSPFTPTPFNAAYGRNDLVTFSHNCGNMSAEIGLPHLSTNAAGFCNFSTPQLMGLIRSAAINSSSAVENFNNVTKTRWCVMWTPYRLTLDYPPSPLQSNAALDTGNANARQLDSREGFRLSILLNGTAIMEEQALTNVYEDDSGSSNYTFPHTLSLKFIDFNGKREEEWQTWSKSSEYMRDVLSSGDPDGFELVSLNNHYEFSVQKVINQRLSNAQKIGWPWAPWPWSDESPFQQISYDVVSNTLLPYQPSNGSHTLALCMLRSTKQVKQITDVPVVYGFFGNVGGALSLVVVLYGCFYTVKTYTPDVETEFQPKGLSTARRLGNWVASKSFAAWRQISPDSNAYGFWPLKVSSRNSIDGIEQPRFEEACQAVAKARHSFNVAEV